jgi:hypothetical protein
MPTVKELEQALKLAKQQEREQIGKLAAIQADSANWEYRAEPKQLRLFNNTTIDGLYITRVLSPKVVQQFTNENTPLHVVIDQTPKGAFYYRTDEGILTTEGVGSYILQVPKLCSDAEWEQMKKSNIPNKFKKA